MGHWRNYEELEENLTFDELTLTLDAMKRSEYERMKFQAALKGVNLEDNGETADQRFERIQNKAKARLMAGGDEDKVELFTEKVTLSDIGIAIEEE